MYYVNETQFDNIEAAISYLLDNTKIKCTIKDINGKDIIDMSPYCKNNCNLKCPNRCIHSIYRAQYTVCHYQWTCECNCNCPEWSGSNKCIICDNILCEKCFIKIDETTGFCSFCYNKDDLWKEPIIYIDISILKFLMKNKKQKITQEMLDTAKECYCTEEELHELLNE